MLLAASTIRHSSPVKRNSVIRTATEHRRRLKSPSPPRSSLPPSRGVVAGSHTAAAPVSTQSITVRHVAQIVAATQLYSLNMALISYRGRPRPATGRRSHGCVDLPGLPPTGTMLRPILG